MDVIGHVALPPGGGGSVGAVTREAVDLLVS